MADYTRPSDFIAAPSGDLLALAGRADCLVVTPAGNVWAITADAAVCLTMPHVALRHPVVTSALGERAFRIGGRAPAHWGAVLENEEAELRIAARVAARSGEVRRRPWPRPLGYDARARDAGRIAALPAPDPAAWRCSPIEGHDERTCPCGACEGCRIDNAASGAVYPW